MKNFKSNDPRIVCFEEGENKVCFHHVKTRKSGGSDGKHNLMPLCLSCHNEVHLVGLTSFAARYIQVKHWLLNNFWELCGGTGKWYHLGEDQ